MKRVRGPIPMRAWVRSGHCRAGWNFLKGVVSGCKHCRADETAPGWELPHNPFHSFLLLFRMAAFLGPSCLDSAGQSGLHSGSQELCWEQGRGSAQPHHCFGQMGSFHKDKTAVPSERQVTLELYNRPNCLGRLFGREEIAYVYFFWLQR